MAESGRTVKVAIAGLGLGSTQIIPAMANMPGLRLVAAADFRRDALKTFRQTYNGRGYDSVEALCQDPEVEAVWVSMPNQLHCEHATLEVCLAIMQSARERREILLTHQSPTAE